MLESITVTNSRIDDGDELVLSLWRPEESGFYIESVDGLGPSDANIITMDMVSMDGSLFNTSRAQKRNIVITLGCWEANDKNLTIEQLRLLTYKYFPIGRRITLTIKTDQRNVHINGYVEKNEPQIFAERVKTQISIICPNPWFQSGFSNVTILSGPKSYGLYYQGDVKSGMKIKMSMTANLNGSIKMSFNGGTFTIDNELVKKIDGLSSGVLSGDILEIDTKAGQKSITLTRGSTVYSLLNILSRDHVWFEIDKKSTTQTITISGGSFTGNIAIPELFEGV